MFVINAALVLIMYMKVAAAVRRPEIQVPYNLYEAEAEIKPKIQLRYNWHITEEEEIENREVTLKQNQLLDTGLTTYIDDDRTTYIDDNHRDFPFVRFTKSSYYV
ncbi:putative disease resistance protein (TIR-NBS-LRR class) [Trifolium medium]|uniref:Putative disease resistance protein (TIR-NBS-LRR class) n=1 Tax=Trifolium medium TaxID=97028 RepID=A0A392MIP9_9FABA|nr:putative disease resistance protein (TIR-NBS-LRR class) [Trifolium medium]